MRFTLKSLPPSIVLKKQQNMFAVVWTTTPWTLPSNQAICYNKNLEYSIVELTNPLIKQSTDLYLIASSLVEDFVKNTKIECKVIQVIRGKINGEHTYVNICVNI